MQTTENNRKMLSHCEKSQEHVTECSEWTTTRTSDHFTHTGIKIMLSHLLYSEK
jgi:hypothetical protein